MEILRIEIENFGKLSAFRQDFTDGVNTVFRENGYGKTTLSVFIKAMFYGLGDTRKTNLFENDRKRFLPWQGGTCGGSLVFRAGGKTYRIERTFGAKPTDDTFTLRDEKSGRVTDDFSEEIGHELFGIDADGFERTVFLSEKNLSGENRNQTVAEKLSDLVGTPGDVGAMDEAIERIEDRRRFYAKKGGSGEISDTERRYAELSRRIEELEELAKRAQDARAEIARLEEETKAANEEKKRLSEDFEKVGKMREMESYEREYAAMKQSLEGVKRRESEILAFFARKLPTDAELDTIAEMSAEARRLSLAAEARRAEATESDDFPAGFDESLKRAKEAGEAAKTKRAALEIRKNERGRVKKTPLWLAFLGAGLAVLCVLLGVLLSPVLYAAAGLGAILIIYTLLKRKSKTRADSAFLSEVKDAEEKISESERAVREFLAEYSESGEGIAEIEERYRRFLAEAERKSASDARAALDKERAESLGRQIEAFLSFFPETEGDRLSAIRRMLGEYRITEGVLAERQTAIADFAARHGVTGVLPAAASDDGALSQRIAETDAKLLEFARRLSLEKREVDAMENELETLDEVREEARELSDRIERYKGNLEILKKTKVYLAEARDNLTARYLDSTKSGFLRYTGAILGDEAGTDEYAMDTDFTVTHVDHGASRKTDAYSRGTRDLFALATRLALVDALYEGELPPLILDDPFTTFDDGRLTRAKDAVKKIGKGRQILYFTCAESRKI